jgi:hypothetical protein
LTAGRLARNVRSSRKPLYSMVFLRWRRRFVPF